MLGEAAAQGRDRVTELTGEELGGDLGPRVLHALEAKEIKGAQPGISPPYSSAEALRTGQPTTGRTLSIKDLLRGAVRHDGTPYALD